MDALQSLLSPWYLQIKFVHLVFMAMWFMSTSVAYRFYLVPVFQSWMRSPGDPDRIALRNWAMERFDDGATLEHVAFPMLLITGPLLMVAGGWSPAQGWFAMKLVIVVLVFIPIEVMDYYLAHFGGNKEKIRVGGGSAAVYEHAMHRHWWFLIVSSPIVIVSIPYVIYLAVAKPF